MVTPAKTSNRAAQFKDLTEKPTQDFDPEDDGPEFSDSDGSESDSGVALNGREHYAPVGKSRLRGRDVAPLGPQYTGSRISRNGLLADDEEHDPFAGYSSDDSMEGVEQNAGYEDGEQVSASDSEFSDDEDDETEASGSGEDVNGGLETDGTSMDDEEDEDDFDDENAGNPPQDTTDRAQLRKILNQDRSNVAVTIAKANKADAEKGIAVKKQRQTFDAVLNGRIRLQQGLVALNSLQECDLQQRPQSEYIAALKAAEVAAVRLWNTIETFKQDLDGARVGTKRKRFEMTADTPLATCWTSMQQNEKESRVPRRNVLQKWSTKTQSATTQTASRKLIGGARQDTILNVLDEQLSNKERLIKRTRMPRSCAPVQASAGVTEAPGIFDDADFYGILLKELLEQRSIDSGNTGEADLAANQWQTVREAKTRKNVDTKASKGRKMRYTVHEKLQNFMAPEDRRTWTERQIDELFGSLLGKRLALGEVEEVEGMEGNAEEEALMLFRS